MSTGGVMAEFTIDYYVNMTTVITADSFEEAKNYADMGVSYTGENISVTDNVNGYTEIRRWWGVTYDETNMTEKDPICFGYLGYYGDWEVCDES